MSWAVLQALAGFGSPSTRVCWSSVWVQRVVAPFCNVYAFIKQIYIHILFVCNMVWVYFVCLYLKWHKPKWLYCFWLNDFTLSSINLGEVYNVLKNSRANMPCRRGRSRITGSVTYWCQQHSLTSASDRSSDPGSVT